MRSRRRLLGTACAVVAVSVSAALAEGDPHGDRLIHHFDFDERGLGNLEDVPRFWERLQGNGFPRYAEATMDLEVGHDAPPSFRLSAEGRNVAFRYTGPEIPVSGRSDYLVVAWIRGDHLDHARAAVSAYYVDYEGLPMRASQRFSDLVTTSDDPDDTERWQRIEVFLPAGDERARSIGLTTWIVHPEVWHTGPRPRRYIERRDMSATAWFDDVRIYRLPRVTLSTSAAGNVFTSGSDATLLAEVTDAEQAGLTARLDIYDVDGNLVRAVDVPVRTEKHAQPVTVDFRSFESGLYRTELTIRTERGEVLSGRALALARLRFAAPEDRGVTRAFGVVMNASDRADPLVELALLKALKVGVVKMPIWSGSADVPDLISSGDSVDVLLYELLKSRVAVTGVFEGPPSDLVRSAGAYRRSLLAMLRDDPDAWREHLVSVFAPYASIFRSWQIGGDGDTSIAVDPRLDQALDRVRAEIRKLATASHLTIPGALTWEPPATPPAVDEVSFAIDPSIAPAYIKSHVESYAAAGQPVTTAYLMPYADENVDHQGQQRDWVKRILHARHAGIQTVLTDQPWRTRMSAAVRVTEPTTELVLLHTVAHMIGDARPEAPVYVTPGVTALAFRGREGTVLAMWDDNAGPEGREHVLQLGSAETVVDMWGRSSPLERAEDRRQRIRLTQDPVFVAGVEPWLVAFRTQLEISPRFVEVSIDAHEHNLRIVNPRDEPLFGQVSVVAPDGWEIEPKDFKFSIPSGGEVVKPLLVSLRRDATAGSHELLLDFDLPVDEGYKVVVPIAMESGVKALIAWGHTVLSGDRLIVRHIVTNRSTETLNLRAFAVAPGRLRQTRHLTQFRPGQTTTLEYHFKNAAALRGRRIRLNLRDLASPRLHNLEVEVQ